MFSKLIDKLKAAMQARDTGPVLPAAERFGDPLAGQVAWSPLKNGGANFKTHWLHFDDAGSCTRKSSAGMKVFAGIFVLMGAGIPGVMIAAIIRSAESAAMYLPALLPLLIGTVFVASGIFMLRSASKPFVFDRREGVLRRRKAASGFQSQDFLSPLPDRKAAAKETKGDDTRDVPLSEIHALQVLSEYCRGNKSSYTSYELNLVLHDASRINIMDHGDPKSLRADARKLADFLGVPLWDWDEAD